MDKQYTAFISYRHCPLDMAVAEALHKRIEHYRVPKDLRKNGQKHMGVVFRDRDELPLSNDLTQDIYEALDNAQFLIVVCTPDTPKSLWVDREIQHFLEKHGHDRILTVLAAGTPEESIPKRITTIYGPDGETVVGEVEPLCAFLVDENERKVLRNLRGEFLRLAAAILRCPYDALRQRQKRYRTRQLIAAGSGVAAVLLTIIGLLIRWNVDVTQKNEEISQKNEEIKVQFQQSQLNESKALTLLSENLLEQGDRMSALENAYNALNGDRPYYAPAEAALVDALNLYSDQGIYAYATLTQTTRVDKVIISQDGKYAITYDTNAGVSGMDVTAQQILWSKPELTGITERSVITEDNQRAVLVEEEQTLVVDMRTGDVLQCISYEEKKDDRNFRVVSPDATLLVVDNRTSEGYSTAQSRYLSNTDVTIYDLSTGTERVRITVDEEVQDACFSKDSSSLLLTGYEYNSYLGYSYCYVLLVDCETGQCVPVILTGGCVECCPLPDGSFLLLCAREAEDDSLEYSYQLLSGDGELQTLTEYSGESQIVEMVLSDGEWIYSIGSSGLQIRCLKDGTVLETISLSDVARSVYPDTGYTIQNKAAFLDEQGRLLVACYDNTICCYYPTSGFDPATCIYGNPAYYTDAAGDPIQVQWNRETLYANALAMNDIFIPREGGKAMAFTLDEDPSRVFFMRLREVEESAELAASVLEKDAYFASICPDAIQANASYDPQSKTLYWEDAQGNMQSAVCPYPVEIELENLFAKIEAGLSGLIVLPNEIVPDGYAIYSTADDSWKWMPFPEDVRSPYEVRVGDSKKWVATISDTHYLQVYDFDRDELLYRGELPLGNVRDIRFICQDQYLLLWDSTSGSTAVMDTSNWEIITELDMGTLLYSPELDQITVTYSSDGSKMYIGELTGAVYGIVLDTQTWTQIAKISGMAFYDADANVIVCREPDTEALYQKEAYSLEALLNIARERLYG